MLFGRQGVGKTSLAAKWARENAVVTFIGSRSAVHLFRACLGDEYQNVQVVEGQPTGQLLDDIFPQLPAETGAPSLVIIDDFNLWCGDGGDTDGASVRRAFRAMRLAPHSFLVTTASADANGSLPRGHSHIVSQPDIVLHLHETSRGLLTLTVQRPFGSCPRPLQFARSNDWPPVVTLRPGTPRSERRRPQSKDIDETASPRKVALEAVNHGNREPNMLWRALTRGQKAFVGFFHPDKPDGWDWQALRTELVKKGTMSQATTYRVLERLCEMGLLTKMEEKGATRVRVTSDGDSVSRLRRSKKPDSRPKAKAEAAKQQSEPKVSVPQPDLLQPTKVLKGPERLNKELVRANTRMLSTTEG